MRYLVTGGGGFIGSNLVAELVRRGEEVRILDDFSTGRRENLAAVEGRCDVIEGSITDTACVRESTRNIDIVFHQAALPSVPRSVAHPQESNAVNVTGTLNILVAAREAAVRRVVLASSSSVYGDSPVMPKHEDIPPRPLSPYAVSKLTGEYYARVFYDLYGLETISLRYFNVFGPHQNPASQYAAVIPLFIAAMLRGEPPTVFGDGLQSRDFSYVDNVVHANLLAAAAPRTRGEAVNIACQETHTILDLIASLNLLTGSRISPVFRSSRKGDILHSLADLRRARELLGYAPVVKWEEGLRRTVAWYRSRSVTAPDMPPSGQAGI